ncbi:MAG: AAA family ATPase [Planctomycetota bacterium]
MASDRRALKVVQAKAMARELSLDTRRRSAPVQRFSESLSEKVVGQQGAITAILDSFSRVIAGIRDRERPILTLLFLGPTGVGKTETVKALAETIFGKRDAFVRINCQEFNNEGAINKLFGSPPGYVGADVEPLLSQEQLDRHHRSAQEERRGVFADGSGRIAKLFPESDEHFLSVICFDEVEKAHPTVWSALLGLMDDGHITLGSNQRVDCTRSIIVMTSNVGADAMSTTLQDRRVGFDLMDEGADQLNAEVSKQAVEAAKQHFPYEFFNRFDDIICFRALARADLRRILGRMLQDIYKRLMDAGVPIILHPSVALKNWLIDRGYDPQFGARPLRRVVEGELVAPLSRLIATEQIRPGQVIGMGLRGGRPRFWVETGHGSDQLLV